jgi:tRNA threonylcarbamoyladenosine biosynthesis protein TsaB
MRILAIDTSGEACSAALYVDGALSDRFVVQPRGHSELILEMMQALLAEAELPLSRLDALAYGRGPGSFTGVRIAAGVIQGAAYGAGLPVVPVSTLAALAQRHHRESGAERVLPAFDARMHEVYWGAYELGTDGLVQLVGRESVSAPELVEVPSGKGWQGVGSGWLSYEEALRQRLGGALDAVHARQLCHARDIAQLAAKGLAAGAAVSAEQALPVYLRNQVASKPRSG